MINIDLFSNGSYNKTNSKLLYVCFNLNLNSVIPNEFLGRWCTLNSSNDKSYNLCVQCENYFIVT